MPRSQSAIRRSSGEVTERGHEVVAHGLDMGTLHHSGLSAEEEDAIVSRALGTLREASGQPVTGWLSPGRAQSFATPDILAANGVRYACDWANDDMPFEMRTAHGPLWAMPLAHETEDRAVLLDFHHTEDDWLLQLKDRFDVLYREADRYGGRVVSVPLHAWVAGVPYRIGIVREALSYMLGHEAVWAATGAEILAAFETASGDPHGLRRPKPARSSTRSGTGTSSSRAQSGPSLLYIDRNIIHEGSFHAFAEMRRRGLKPRRPEQMFGVPDHYVPTRSRRAEDAPNPQVEKMIRVFDENMDWGGVPSFRLADRRQGIVHVIGPEQGITQPGLTIVCSDSHTSTHGALGAIAFGIGQSENAHVMATQTLWQVRPRTFRITVEGLRAPGVER